MRRSLLAILATSVLALAACETSEDPFAGTTDTGSGSRDTIGTQDVGTDTTTEDVAVDTMEDTAEDVGLVDGCGDGVVFTGQVFVDDEPDALSPNGGAPRFEPWDASYDAGIAALVEAAPTSGDPITGEWTVTEATVVATDYNSPNTQRAQRSFWLGDGNATIQVFFFAEDVASQPTFSVKVGQRISGTVTSLGQYQGMAQVATADGASWTLESEDNEVYIRDVTGPLTADDAHAVVRVTGTLVGIDNPDCGGAQCYEMVYGDNQEIILRTGSEFTAVGMCVTYVGPVRLFSGEAQLDTQNYDWLWTYDD